MTVERRRFEFNRHLTWFVPPIDPARRWNPILELDPEACVLDGVDPERWDAAVHSVLTAVYHSEVGRAVISCLQRRTSLYHFANTAQTDADAWEGADDQYAPGIPNTSDHDQHTPSNRARREPMPAVLMIDILRPPPPAGTTPQTREGRTLHELAHAVTITWGAFAARPTYNADMQRVHGTSSFEEAIAWIIENMWRGEQRLPYRGSYNDSRPLGRPPTDDTTGHPVTTLESSVVDYLWLRVPLLASRLWQLPHASTPYNPFRVRRW